MPPLPATTDVLLEFLDACPSAPATLTKRVRMVDRLHRALGYPAPGSSPQVRDLLRGRAARPMRQEVTAEQLRAALEVLPSHGWTAGWFGRRDRALLVLAHQAGLSYQRIAQLTAGDLTFTTDGPVTITTPTGPVAVEPDTDPMLCGVCCLARWMQALNLVVTFQTVANHIDHAKPVTADTPHACTDPVVVDDCTRSTALLPPADQWGSTDINPEPLRPQSLSALSRLHGAGHHAVHRHRPRPLRDQPRAPAAASAVTPPPFGQADWRAGWERRNADRDRLADLDAVLDDVDRRAKELERRTNELLINGAI